MKEKLNQWLYYVIIGAVSFVALVFLPMLGSSVGLAWAVPTTVVGWIVWITSKIIIATLNVLIFHCFMLQAKVNIKDDPKYNEANRILTSSKDKGYVPRGPSTWITQQYRNKGITIFITSALSVFALSQAILTFDYVSMLTYLFTIIMGLIFGILQMKSAELYWTTEYWEYAQTKITEQETLNNDNLQEQRITELGRTSVEEQTGHSVSL